MNLREVDLNFLVVFDAIYHQQNLTKAGEQLNMSQPAVSNALNKLRDIFNNPLFVKTSQGMQPTPRADALAEPIHQIILQLKSVFLEPRDYRPQVSQQTFRLSMSDYSEFVILPKLLNILSEIAPDIQVTVVHTSRKERHKLLESGKLNLAIYSRYPNQEFQEKYNTQFSSITDLYSNKLFNERVVVTAREGHPFIQNKITMKQFLECSHALFLPHGEIPEHDSVDQILLAQGTKRNVTLRTPHTSSHADIIGKTNLIGTTVERYARATAVENNLQVLEVPFQHPPFEMTMYWHTRVHQDPANRWLREQIKEVCRAI